MSKGPGLWQRLILEYLASNIGFPLREFWRLVKPKRAAWTRSEYSALLRAAHVLADKGECQLLRADDIENGAVAPSRQSNQSVLFVARPGVSITSIRRQRSTSRQWVTNFSFEGSNAAEWLHDPTPNPDGSTWSRVSATSSEGHTSDNPEGDHWYVRRRKKILVREPNVTWLEALVGLGGRVSVKEKAERIREARRILGQDSHADHPRTDPDEKPLPRGEWEGSVPAGITNERTRAVALAIVFLSRVFQQDTSVSRLQELAGDSLAGSLRRLARSGFLYVDDRDRLFMLRGNELPGPEPRQFHTRRAVGRLNRILSQRIAASEPGTAELTAEIMAESVSVDALSNGATG